MRGRRRTAPPSNIIAINRIAMNRIAIKIIAILRTVHL